jgi:hypothetical protein
MEAQPSPTARRNIVNPTNDQSTVAARLRQLVRDARGLERALGTGDRIDPMGRPDERDAARGRLEQSVVRPLEEALVEQTATHGAREEIEARPGGQDAGAEADGTRAGTIADRSPPQGASWKSRVCSLVSSVCGWRGELTDVAWARIEPLLPGSGRGRRWRDHRQVINGILWQLRTGGAVAGHAGALRALEDLP